MTRNPEHVGAPSPQDLEEMGLVRCERCHQIYPEAKVDSDGYCIDCSMPEEELATEDEIEPSAARWGGGR